MFPAGQYGFGRAGFVQFENFNDAKNAALLYHDVEYIVKYKEKYSLRWKKGKIFLLFLSLILFSLNIFTIWEADLSSQLTPTLVGLGFAYIDGWSLWRLFSFNLPYFDNYLNFWPRMISNKLDKILFSGISIIKNFLIWKLFHFR